MPRQIRANINDRVVNQSFTFGAVAASEQESIDSAYDNYAAQYNTLFVSAACNYGISASVCAPGTSYNCISVGAYQNGSSYNSVGPTIDNGRCKPDITAPVRRDEFFHAAGRGRGGGADAGRRCAATAGATPIPPPTSAL